MKISRKLAIQILKYLNLNKDFYFPFSIVYKKEDEKEKDDFVEIEPNEFNKIESNHKYRTFEIWENLQNIDEKTTKLMAKGFIEKIISEQ